MLSPPSEQPPCRSAEVKFFSVFLCQRCREIWREILVKFSVLRFPGFGCATENFTKISRQKRCEKRKFHANFTLLGRSADPPPLQNRYRWNGHIFLSIKLFLLPKHVEKEGSGMLARGSIICTKCLGLIHFCAH